MQTKYMHSAWSHFKKLLMKTGILTHAVIQHKHRVAIHTPIFSILSIQRKDTYTHTYMHTYIQHKSQATSCSTDEWFEDYLIQYRIAYFPQENISQHF